SHYRELLAMRQAQYPKARFALGHPNILFAFQELATVLWERGEQEQADAMLYDAVPMAEKIYGPNYPNGHPQWIGLVQQRAETVLFLVQQRAETIRFSEEAERLHWDAVRMLRKLYPKEQFPRGHHELAV